MPLYGNITLPDRPDPENIRRLDLLQVPMLRQMMRFGMRIDVPYFAALSSKLQSRMADLRCDILNEIPPESLDRFVEVSLPPDDESSDSENSLTPPTEDVPFNVESGAKIAELLYDVLGLQFTKGVKVKKTKGGERLSTGKKTLEQLKREHPVVPLILEYRECSKLDGTYARSMPRQARFHPHGKDCPLCGRHHWTDEWRVHTQLLTTRTATGRTASKSPNLGNIPTRTKLGQEIRNGFIASEGHVIAQRDWAQIEVRLMADRSGDPTLIQIYAEDGDVHVRTAIGVFPGVTVEEVSKGPGKLLYRAPAKNCTFATAYGITGAGLLDLMAVTFATANTPMPDYMTEQWCDEFIEKWFALYPRVRKYLRAEEEKARRFGIVWTAAGRVRRVPEVRSCHSYIQEAGVRQAANHGIQGYSADIMKLAMGESGERLQQMKEYGISAFPEMSIYDELLIECPEDDGDTVEALLEEVMNNVLIDKATGRSYCRVPIKSDGGLMKRWSK